MPTLCVGKPFLPHLTSLPEGLEYNFHSGIHGLKLFLPNMSPREIAAARNGTIELALFIDQPVIFLLFRIDGLLDWSECPYTIHAISPDERTPPPPAVGVQRHGLFIVAADSTTAIVQTLRFATMPPDFTARLHAEIRAQLASPFDQDTYNQHLQQIRNQYPDVRDMVSHAVARGIGGQ